MQRDISFSNEARKKVKAGIDKAAKAITVTLGGAGRSVLIEKQIGYPTSTKDGVTVAKAIELHDRLENMGALLIREAAAKTVDVAGDGTTCSSLLTQKIIEYGMACLEAGANPVDLKSGIEKEVALVVERIKKLAVPANEPADLKKIATISANNDEEIGRIVSEAIDKVGRDGIVEVEEAQGYETTIDIVEGMQIDKGYISPYFINNEKKMKCELEQPMIFLYEKKLTSVKEVAPLLESVSKTGRSLLIICEDVSEDILKVLVMNKINNGFKVCVIKLPTFGGSKKLVMEDLAVLTNGRFVAEEKGDTLKKVTTTMLGSAEKVIITKDKTTIIGGAGGRQLVQERCEQIKVEIENAETDFEKGKLKERLAKLAQGVAVLKIGGATEGEISEKKDRVDDALCATRAAIDEGYVAGGGVTYLKCASNHIQDINASDGELKGRDCVRSALSDPLIKILENAGIYTPELLNQVSGMDYGFGVNVKTGKIENLLYAGIIDPAKVLRVALENAASVAALFLTTECVISNLQDNL